MTFAYKILYIMAKRKRSVEKPVAKAAPVEKPIKWMGSSLEDLKGFPKGIVATAGFQLHLVQHGLEPNDWAPISTVGAGCNEIRLNDKDGWYRIIYVAKFENAVYVLHSFQKKTNETSKADIDLATARYKQAKIDHEEGKK